MGVLLQHISSKEDPCGLLVAKPQITSEPRLLRSSKVVSAVYSVNDCVLDFGEKTKMSQDCLGNETYVSGKVKLKAKQTKHGIRRFQNETHLVIPWPDNEHEYDLDIIVHLSHDPQSGLCTIPTPEITVKHIRYSDSILESPGMLGSVQVAVQKDVFLSVFAALEPKHFSEVFKQWAQFLSARLKTLEPHIAIDGKTSRKSYDSAKGIPAIHTVSAWLGEAGLVLGQVKTETKSNEITALKNVPLSSVEIYHG